MERAVKCWGSGGLPSSKLRLSVCAANFLLFPKSCSRWVHTTYLWGQVISPQHMPMSIFPPTKEDSQFLLVVITHCLSLTESCTHSSLEPLQRDHTCVAWKQLRQPLAVPRIRSPAALCQPAWVSSKPSTRLALLEPRLFKNISGILTRPPDSVGNDNKPCCAELGRSFTEALG